MDRFLWGKLATIREVAADTIGEVAKFKEFDQVHKVDAISAKTCVEEAINRLKFPIAEADVSLNIVDPGSPRVSATMQLTDVFENLIRNSIEAMQDSPEKKIHIDLAESAPETNSADCLEVTVTDTGPGIPPAIKSQLFQFGTTTKQTGRGGGYGLWWVRTWLRRLGGDIHHDETYGGGARFLITLPLVSQNGQAEEAR
jgi:signal transduction histidine kinase